MFYYPHQCFVLKWGILLICLGCLLHPGAAMGNHALHSAYPFASAKKRARFENLTGNLRCLVCQNESLWDSNAPLAVDLRRIVYQQVKQGATDQAIKQYLVARYGEFILLQPVFKTTTYLLWIVPFCLLFFSMGIVIWWVHHNKARTFAKSD